VTVKADKVAVLVEMINVKQQARKNAQFIEAECLKAACQRVAQSAV